MQKNYAKLFHQMNDDKIYYIFITIRLFFDFYSPRQYFHTSNFKKFYYFLILIKNCTMKISKRSHSKNSKSNHYKVK